MTYRTRWRPSGARGSSSRRPQRATALIETLLAAPIVLLLGMGALQWALLFHARAAVEYGVFEAARAGSVAQARVDAIEQGLARGLLPFWQGTSAGRPLPVALAASQVQLRNGLMAGWIAWRQLSPTAESFADWAEPARDAMGRPMLGISEIPNDSLQWAMLRSPASGSVALRGSEPIGAGSQQTLNDANLLKLELRYAVPMTVPLVGSLAVWLLRIVDGCAPPSSRRIGLVDLGTPAAAPAARAWACSMYYAPDASGRPVPRWPVRASAMVRMQSAARRSAMTPHRAESAVYGASAGGASGSSESLPAATVAGVALPPVAGSGSDADADADADADSDADSPDPAFSGLAPIERSTRDADAIERREASGWLHLGGERTFSVPGACTG